MGEIEDTINTNNFFIKKEGFYLSDRLLDDNSIFIQAKDASILLLGCAHSGILNILQKVESEYNIDTGLVIIGGLHLVGLNRSSIKEIADKIDKYDIKKIIPCHCTGITGYEVLKEVFGQRCVMGEVSKVFISD